LDNITVEPVGRRGHPLRAHLRRPGKINFSTVLACQAAGIKGVHGDIWLASFMDYDLG